MKLTLPNRLLTILISLVWLYSKRPILQSFKFCSAPSGDCCPNSWQRAFSVIDQGYWCIRDSYVYLDI